jgi:ATP-dependent helicase/nuclease subunit A
MLSTIIPKNFLPYDQSMPTILPKDTDVRLPDFTLVSASAGSGKTTQLTYRLLQLLLSQRIPNNKLQNILAITFTNNAAAEMKQRTLEFLKRAALGDKDMLNDLRTILTLDADKLQRRAEVLIDDILNNYSDFQVQTIDSFLTRVMRVSALELGIVPQFDIVFDNTQLLDEAFAVFARDLAEDPQKRSLVESLIALLNEQRDSGRKFLWNPYENLVSEIKGLYETLASRAGMPRTVHSDGRLNEDVESAGQLSLDFARTPPPNQASSPAYAYYEPYVRAYNLLFEALRKVQTQRGILHLALANKTLATHIRDMDIPEIYFSLGERIHHFLIDEFQDTNPTQWAVLRPLMENALSGPGSVFIVGDTKQAIYTFRGGDWQIMAKMLKQDEFPSVITEKKILSENFRSGEAILEFTKRVFHRNVPSLEGTSTPSLSGLSTFEQHPDETQKEKGYVEVEVFENAELLAEKERLLEIIRECRKRNYAYRDIAIFTPRNKHVIAVSSWLNGAHVPFVSHSNLDIRARKLTGEVLAVLRFLDSPIDDLGFATVLLGDLFRSAVGIDSFHSNDFLFKARQQKQRRGALYTFFRDWYPQLWEKYFEHLFTVVGYMPIYDLVAEVYKSFALFDSFPEEEASLVKFLEVVRDFEATGTNNLRSFIQHAEESTDEELWNIAVAPGEDAVKVMTVHKAKGLGFPINIVLLYDAQDQRDNLAIVESEGEVLLVRVTRKLSKDDPEIEQLYQEKKTLLKVDDLNKLYVALTRAKDELYVLSVKARRGKTPSAYLPESGYSIGKRENKREERHPEHKQASIAHPHTRGFAQAKETIRLRSEETERGEFIHAILERIIFVERTFSSLSGQIDEIVQSFTDKKFDVRLIKERIAALLKDGLQPYFIEGEGRTVLNEQSIVSPDGKIHRIDRLVIDPDRVTVIDFKTGSEAEDHHEQVREYMKLVHQLYPDRTVEGLLAYVDLQVLRRVET